MGVIKYGKMQGVHFSKPHLIMVICRGARDSSQGLGMYLEDISWTVGEDYSKQCITLFTAIRIKRCIYEALWPGLGWIAFVFHFGETEERTN